MESASATATANQRELQSSTAAATADSNRGRQGVKFHLPKLIHYKWWLRITCYIFFLLTGQSAATLLGRLYYDKGGNSKWMATLVQSAGFPLLLPLLLYFLRQKHHHRSGRNHLRRWLPLIYLGFGVLLTADNLMYSYGLLYLPVSTYSLLCATQLAFNAVFSFFLNNQKFTPFILNSLVLLTVSATLLAVNSADDDTASSAAKNKYAIGFLTTVGASAAYSLYLSLIQLTFDNLVPYKENSTVDEAEVELQNHHSSAAAGVNSAVDNNTLHTLDSDLPGGVRVMAKAVVEMQIYPSAVATVGCVVGIFASGEWKEVKGEMRGYTEGKAAYLLTLIWTAVAWQVSSLGMLGLVFEVSSLFSNVISTLALPLVPVLAVVLFGDKMDGVKAVAMVLAVWGFVSYVYQHYLDDRSTAERTAAGGDARECGNADRRAEIC
ncbi:unnamed protein product [Linum trigynum]|uniref:Probable purine permease n=1 Tax=Linum trigynum TaxID=586398 RepID=A0AAV2DR92_9ROSI